MKAVFAGWVVLCALTACSSPETATNAPTAPSPIAQQTVDKSADKKVVLIDVRSAEEFQAGHLPNAHNLTHDHIGQNIATLTNDKNAEIHVYCRSGRRSEMALQTLKSLGYTNVKNLGAYDDLVKKSNAQ